MKYIIEHLSGRSWLELGRIATLQQAKDCADTMARRTRPDGTPLYQAIRVMQGKALFYEATGAGR